MNHQKDDMELKDYTNNSQNKDFNNANNEKKVQKMKKILFPHHHHLLKNMEEKIELINIQI